MQHIDAVIICELCYTWTIVIMVNALCNNIKTTFCAQLLRFVAVNGKVLKMVDSSTLPTVKPVTQQLSKGITLPPLSFGFFVLPNARAAACMQH